MRRSLSILLAICLVLSALCSISLAAEYDTYTGSVIAAVNQSFSAESLESGSFASKQNSAQAQMSVVGTSVESDISNIVVDEETGEVRKIRSLTFDELVPQGVRKTSVGLDDVRANYVVGNTFNVYDNNCEFRPVQCLYVGNYCTVWGSTADAAEICIDADDAREIGMEFDSYYHQTINAFGSWYDADHDGKLAIFCYDLDEEYPQSDIPSYLGGFFRPADLVDVEGCINDIYFGTEYYYNMAKDGIHIDTYPAMGYTGKYLEEISNTYSTLVHEFQHLINFSYQVAGGTDESLYASMETYLNEAFSMAAEHMICGASACESRISYFNAANAYTPGSPLCYWENTLSNYSNSYLFGQYIRTRYAAKTGTDGNSIFKMILEARQRNAGGDTLQMIADVLETTESELIMNFWTAVLTKEQSGPLGFGGETWADSITPQIYESTDDSTGNIYNGGAKFYRIGEGGFTPSEKNNVEFIAFTSSETDEEGYIPGDINGDGSVTTRDVTTLRRYIAGGYDIFYVEALLDVNGDGVVTTKDVTTLRRYIAGGYGIELS